LGKIDADPEQLVTAIVVDRMLVAQALVEPLRLLTADTTLAHYGDLVTVV
jgi:PIN domain nuclease of toxin-antitoxin system